MIFSSILYVGGNAVPQLFDSVRYLKGVGEARAKQLHNLGIDTLYDLIAYFPRAYEDRSRMIPIAELEADTPACFEAMVVSQPRLARIRKGLDRLAAANVVNHSLSNLDTLVDVAVEEKYITPAQKEQILQFRNAL